MKSVSDNVTKSWMEYSRPPQSLRHHQRQQEGSCRPARGCTAWGWTGRTPPVILVFITSLPSANKTLKKKTPTWTIRPTTVDPVNATLSTCTQIVKEKILCLCFRVWREKKTFVAILKWTPFSKNVLGVKTLGWWVRAAPVSPKPVTTLITPGGKPTSKERAAKARAVKGVWRLEMWKRVFFWKRLKRYKYSKMRLQNVLLNSPYMGNTIFWYSNREGREGRQWRKIV